MNIKFHWLTGSGGTDASLCQISSKSVHPLQSYCDLFFQDGGCRHLGFQKFSILLAAGVLPSCQISSKLVNPLKRYHNFSIYQDGGCRHIGFFKFSIFIGRCSPEGQGASLCQISSKLVKQFFEIPQFLYFSKIHCSISFS